MFNSLEFIRCSYKYSAYKKFRIYPFFIFFFLDIFQNQPNMFAILEFIRQLL